MNLEEFEAQIRDGLEQALNQLQTATLLVAQLETQISETGHSVQNLSRIVESFLSDQRQQRERSEGTDSA
jgi:ferritin-like metal-binding protein YciE